MTEALEDTKIMNRWIVVVGAIMIQLALGAIYAWSAFTGPLEGINGIAPSQFGFSSTQTQAIFSAGLATFAIFTIIGGRLQKKYSPRKIAMLGGVLLGVGYLMGGYTGANFPLKLVGIGIIGGAGIGLAYVVPLAVGLKWFPDKKGLVSGLAVAGFGFGAFIWILMANPPPILGFSGIITRQTGEFAYTIANVDLCFRIYGILFFVLVILGSLVMINPPDGWKPKGWEPENNRSPGSDHRNNELIPKQMLKTRQFYLLWMMFFIGALAGLMVIGNIQNFANDPSEGFMSHGYSDIDASNFAVIGAAVCLPILNGIGRIAWGQISDKIGRRHAIITMCLFQAAMMGVFYFTTFNPIVFFIVAAAIGFNFGGNFALYPAATSDSFGTENVGLNYGYVFTSYGIGGIAGPILAGVVQDMGWSFTYAFYTAMALCLLAALFAFIFNPKVDMKD